MKRPAEEIIDRVLDNCASSAEAANVALWFATDEGEEYLSARMEREYFHEPYVLEYESMGNEPDREKISELIDKRIRRVKLRRTMFAAAAVVVPLFIIALAMFKIDSRVDLFGNAAVEEIAVAKGEKVQVIFPDGSRAYLNSDSRLSYPQKFTISNRKVRLEGEGYFVVNANPERPFIIDVEGGSVTVTGTSFNVKAYPGDDIISVALDEGKVNFASSGSDNEYDLIPGDMLVFNREKGYGNISNDASNSSLASLWKSDILMLDDKPLREVVDILGRWYGVEFVIDDREVEKYSFTLMVSEKTPLNEVLRDFEKVAPVRFVRTGNVVKVTGVYR